MTALPYVLVGVGLVLIFLWARSRQSPAEGFENNGVDASYVSTNPYKFNMYYVDWCPHCHHAKPEFEKLGAIQTIGGKKVQCSAIHLNTN